MMSFTSRYGFVLAGLCAAAALDGAALATPYGDPDDEPHAVTRVRDFFVVADDQDLDPRIAAADLEYARNMRRHHQGAVDMARLYLEDPRGTNPVLRRLAQAIIANQEFEIGILDNVRHSVAMGPRPVAEWRGRQLVVLERGVDGLEHVWQYSKAPPPSLADVWLARDFRMSEFDVQLARPMVQHHEMALRMARAYNSNTSGTNTILRRLNVALLVDQDYEIRFLKSLLARYRGEAGGVADDPQMMEIIIIYLTEPCAKS